MVIYPDRVIATFFTFQNNISKNIKISTADILKSVEREKHAEFRFIQSIASFDLIYTCSLDLYNFGTVNERRTNL